MSNDLNSPQYTTSLSRKAALTQTTIITVVVIFFSIAILSFNSYRLYTQLENRLTNISTLARTSLTSAVWQVDHASARDFIEAVLLDESVAYAQLVTGHEILASRSRQKYADKSFSFFQNNKKFLTQTVEIRKFGDWIGTFQVALSADQLKNEILVNAGVTLLLAVILIITISHMTLRFSRKRFFYPLKRLEQSATAIADGDLDAPVDTSQPGELGSLARSFDDMRESVRHLIEDLQTANTKLQTHQNNLEKTIHQRTEELREKNKSLNQAIEDVRKAQQGAEVANLAKSRFLASMSHEIRTPMNAILGMADILWETELTEAQAKYVQVFRTAGESLLAILNDILDLSKIEAGHLELEKTNFSLTETVDKACAMIEPKALEKNIEFTCRVNSNVPDRLKGDPTRLRQVIINLLGNAVKFTEKGAVSILVETMPEQHGSHVIQFSIIDTGPGIPTDKLGTIFDSFTQADSSTTREFGGTGLGLAICRQLVNLMGGKIWAESSPGKGSTFHFTTTFEQQGYRHHADTLHDIPSCDLDVLPHADILIAEDSKYNAYVLHTYLKNTPCRLMLAETGEEALALFKKHHFDLVLMDIQMPEMDGYEAMKAIRRHEKDQSMKPTPIVAMTAYALENDAHKCREAGANRHLPKPVKRHSLFELICSLLNDPAPLAAGSAQQDSEEFSWLVELDTSIQAALLALQRNDFASIQAFGADISQRGIDMAMPTLSGYGEALSEASAQGNSPDRTRQVLTILTEYIERLRSV